MRQAGQECESSGLVLDGITNMHLIARKCPNGHTHIFGFFHEIPLEAFGEPDLQAMTVTVTRPCYQCGCEVKKVFKLKWDADAMIDGAGI